MTDLLHTVQSRAGTEPVKLGLILGSGLGHLAHAVDGVAIPYADLPGFPHVGVSGHNPHLHLGTLEGVRVAVFGAREHYYENGNSAAMRPALDLLQALGADHLIVTNAAGSLRPDIRPGDLMLLNDHINFSGLNPLIGEKTDARFVPMTTAHDPDLRAALRAAAKAEGVALPEGVYAWYSGPSFETPAEIRMLRTLGADAVGMSTVPEVIAAAHMGVPVAGLSCLTNMASGILDQPLSHAEVTETADRVRDRFVALLAALLPKAVAAVA
jgi:purine-nucleoside phosphorylase